MHKEEGIYETADPDRGSNTRGETPDSERYRRFFHYERSLVEDEALNRYGYRSTNPIASATDSLSSRASPGVPSFVLPIEPRTRTLRIATCDRMDETDLFIPIAIVNACSDKDWCMP